MLAILTRSCIVRPGHSPRGFLLDFPEVLLEIQMCMEQGNPDQSSEPVRILKTYWMQTHSPSLGAWCHGNWVRVMADDWIINLLSTKHWTITATQTPLLHASDTAVKSILSSMLMSYRAAAIWQRPRLSIISSRHLLARYGFESATGMTCLPKYLKLWEFSNAIRSWVGYTNAVCLSSIPQLFIKMTWKITVKKLNMKITGPNP